MKKTLLLGIALGSVLLGGCSFEPAIKARAAFDLQCGQEQIQVSQIGASSFGARGCGRQGTYVITPNGQVVLNSAVDVVGAAASTSGTVKPPQ
jgi:hypothetical protein